MEKLFIIIVDDQREVVNTVTKDIEQLADLAQIEECESGEEVLELIDEIDSEGDYVAVIISDHVMPGMTGVELLSNVDDDPRFKSTRKILLTGLATHEDTIEAINQAHINMYFDKPWDKEKLVNKVRQLLTEFVLEKGLDYSKYQQKLDQETLLKKLRSGGSL